MTLEATRARDFATACIGMYAGVIVGSAAEKAHVPGVLWFGGSALVVGIIVYAWTTR